MIAKALKTVLGILEKCHVCGAEAETYAEAMKIIKVLIKALEEEGKNADGNHSECEQNG